MGKNNRRAQVGIGTLIIFIAMVLVAAVAAAVLIQTSGVLQQKASQTGQETTAQVSAGVQVNKIVGYDADAPGGTITRVAVYIKPTTGTENIDLNQATLSLTNGDKLIDYVFESSAYVSQSTATGGNFDIFNTSNGKWENITSQRFGIVVLQDYDSSVTSTAPTINENDKVALTINMSADSMTLPTRTTVSGRLQPEIGAPAIISFTTPSAYTDNIIVLQS